MTATSELLTPQQIEELRRLYRIAQAQHDANNGALGIWVPVYEALYAQITDFTGVDHPKTGVDRQTWLWLRGARFVNGGQGPFAELIRQTTIIQHTLRYGSPPSDAQMNRASNNIAQAFLGQWLGFAGDVERLNTQPTILETGIYDAGPAASGLR
jgi:hypothetical protein